jgi:hypothetical protein
MRVFLEDIDDFRYIYYNMITNSTIIYCNGICMREDNG